jgi:hypothetical protein
LGRPYAEEVAELGNTFFNIVEAGSEALADLSALQRRLGNSAAYFIGSGGALAPAELAATVHTQMTGWPAQAVTPLHAVSLSRSSARLEASVVLFSARARHPDVRIAATALRQSAVGSIALVTQLPATALDQRLCRAVDHIVTLPAAKPDGFLATNSVLAFATAWLVAAGVEAPRNLPWLDAPLPHWPQDVGRVLILYASEHRSAAVDLEARFAETGLLDVQLADFRNVAHGRHVGLDRHSRETAVICLTSTSLRTLALRTVSALPQPLTLVELKTDVPGHAGNLDLLVASMRLVGHIAAAKSVDPGRPFVTSSGRKLYHLAWPAPKQVDVAPDRPYKLKAAAAGLVLLGTRAGALWRDAHSRYIERLSSTVIRGIILDYDGTCVDTQRRFNPPDVSTQSELTRLAQAGIRLGIATGRGQSVISMSRSWLPKPLAHARLWHPMPLIELMSRWTNCVDGHVALECCKQGADSKQLTTMATHRNLGTTDSAECTLVVPLESYQRPVKVERIGFGGIN